MQEFKLDCFLFRLIKMGKNFVFGCVLIFVPTFDTKVTEYLSSGWVFFFFRQISTFYLAIFDGFFYHSKGIVVLSLNLKRYFTCDHFS